MGPRNGSRGDAPGEPSASAPHQVRVGRWSVTGRVSASWRRANPAPVGCSLSHLGLDGRQVPLLLREPGSSAGRPAPEPRSGVRRVPPSGLYRKPSSPLEARVSPEFRAAMSVGEIKVTPNRFGDKRLDPTGCAKRRRARWITGVRPVDAFKKPSRCRGVSCPQQMAARRRNQADSAAFMSSSRSQSSSARARRARVASRSAESLSKRLRSEV